MGKKYKVKKDYGHPFVEFAPFIGKNRVLQAPSCNYINRDLPEKPVNASASKET